MNRFVPFHPPFADVDHGVAVERIAVHADSRLIVDRGRLPEVKEADRPAGKGCVVVQLIIGRGANEDVYRDGNRSAVSRQQ